jgi:hypothetical protein
MKTLSNGYKLPENKDKGSSFFPALEYDIQRINDHRHDGNDSTPLSTTSLERITVVISSANWQAVDAGQYRQLITTPAGIVQDNAQPVFKVNGGDHGGAVIYPEIKWISETQYYISVNDPSISIKVIY